MGLDRGRPAAANRRAPGPGRATTDCGQNQAPNQNANAACSSLGLDALANCRPSGRQSDRQPLPFKAAALITDREPAPRSRHAKPRLLTAAPARRKAHPRRATRAACARPRDRAAACRARQRLEMVGAGAFGRQQQEDQVDRLAVECLEIDRPLQPRKQAERLLSSASLPCGMATPLPTPVEPSFSRCMRISKIARSPCPVSPRPPWPRSPAAPASSVDLQGRDDCVRRNEIRLSASNRRIGTIKVI